MKKNPKEKHPEVRIYKAQAREDARALREGRRPNLIARVSDITDEDGTP